MGAAGSGAQEARRSGRPDSLAENPIRAVVGRLAQILARFAPGATSVRVALHRIRGVRIGHGCFIGSDVMIETAHPERIRIGDHVVLGIRSLIIGHFDPAELGRPEAESRRATVQIDDEVFVGPGVIVLPNVRIGRGSVVMAGSVVTRSVPPQTVVQGNPARPVGRCRVPLRRDKSIWSFYSAARSLSDRCDPGSQSPEAGGRDGDEQTEKR